jgi:hypothetical protein
MDTTMLVSVIAGVLIAGMAGYFIFLQRKGVTQEHYLKKQSNTLPLQAYERLTLLVDRIALPNLISRTNAQGLSARELQLVLTKTIRDEFDYNVTQQIYVTPEAWNAVRNLKEQNLLLINQYSQTLPAEAFSADLQKALLNYLMQSDKANLHELVSEALSYEAKKLL